MVNKNRLKGAIASAGLSQRKLAECIGKSKDTVNAKVNGRGYFDTKEIDDICRILGIEDNIEKANIFYLSNPKDGTKQIQDVGRASQ